MIMLAKPRQQQERTDRGQIGRRVRRDGAPARARDRRLDHVEEIAAPPGLDGIYLGPADLSLGLGASAPGDPAVADALVRIRRACETAGIVAGIHTPSRAAAAQRLSDGFTVVTVAHDVAHLIDAATTHLAAARDPL